MNPLPTLMVAPNGARKTKADHPALPITLEEIITEAIQCHDAGADGIHLHVRGKNGGHILDAGLYHEAIDALRKAVPNMIVQITTEAVGLYAPHEQRKIVEDVQPDYVSVSLAEMCEGGDIAAAVKFYARCAEADIAVQHILYGPQDLTMMTDLFDKGLTHRDDLQVLFVLGRYSKNQESLPANLDPFIAWMNKSCPQTQWGVCAFGKHETDCLLAAYRQNGRMRVGFENSFSNRDGTQAKSNAERVAEISALTQRYDQELHLCRK